MKVCIFLVLIVQCRGVDGAPFLGSTSMLSKNTVIKPSSPAKTLSGIDAFKAHPVLNTRGGSTENNLAAAWIAIHALPGALLPAPNRVAEFYNWNVKSNFAPGSFQEFVQENYISTCIGIAVLAYLTIFKAMDATKAIAYTTLGCCFVNYKALLNDTFAKWGAPKGMGVISLALFAGLYYAVFFSGSANADLITKLFMAPVTLLALIGFFDPAAARDALGAKTQSLIPNTNKTQFLWMCRAILVLAVAGYSLMFGVDPVTATGYAAIVGSVFVFDAGFIRKDSIAVSPKPTLILFNIVYALIGIGLLAAKK